MQAPTVSSKLSPSCWRMSASDLRATRASMNACSRGPRQSAFDDTPASILMAPSARSAVMVSAVQTTMPLSVTRFDLSHPRFRENSIVSSGHPDLSALRSRTIHSDACGQTSRTCLPTTSSRRSRACVRSRLVASMIVSPRLTQPRIGISRKMSGVRNDDDRTFVRRCMTIAGIPLPWCCRPQPSEFRSPTDPAGRTNSETRTKYKDPKCGGAPSLGRPGPGDHKMLRRIALRMTKACQRLTGYYCGDPRCRVCR